MQVNPARSTCGFQAQFITQGCNNITTRGQYEAKNSHLTLNNVVKSCKKTLQNRNFCAECSLATSGLGPSDSHEALPSDVKGEKVYYESDCVGYRWMYAAAFGNSYGPTDRHTANCLLALTFDSPKSNKKHIKTITFVFLAFGFLILVMACVGFWLMWRYKLNMYKRQKKVFNSSPDLDTIGGDATLIKFTLSEVQKATNNFSLLNIIGRGKYGNVFKGILPDGTEVAVKRFKNCSAAGDASFAHEVEVIASVLHVNLVALRGYCISITNFGIVLLELLTGKKALLKHGDHQHTLLADWAWSLVKTGRPLDVVEEGIAELGPPEIMENYVFLSVICCHPQLYARPTMDQIVKILDSLSPNPVIPERPVSVN
ncbi:hypothetical protein ACET3Z_002529 [Daucus carota]